eukprot:TRINITY_DN66824_c0_g1_i1.p1 TRINITY_DN66824_c0_g1~~TRINITY_DN66824_c0_g1_i1.p1  ORF type:complete len:127 (+),score=16.08 TRINITY_DN66824_c0_g1_i1:71-451(+)
MGLNGSATMHPWLPVPCNQDKLWHCSEDVCMSAIIRMDESSTKRSAKRLARSSSHRPDRTSALREAVSRPALLVVSMRPTLAAIRQRCREVACKRHAKQPQAPQEGTDVQQCGGDALLGTVVRGVL